ncbi:MAG: ChaN family lipoprotein [Rhizobiales bacterium]|nr:ChaN family lipoprotein [Rhizobacter sp.]
MRSRPIVLLGEVHDNALQHAMRAAALRALLEGGARPALLMEPFDREHQADLDRALARPGVTADEVIAAAAPGDPAMQGWSWPFYRPYIALAIQYRLPIVAANVSRNDTRRVLKDGLQSLGFDASVPADIEAVQARAIVDGHCGMIDTPLATRMVGAQVARDQFMARAIEMHSARGAVLIAGNGHVRRDVGVPRWLSESTRARSVAIGLLEPGDANVSRFDVAFTTTAQSRADPCESMRGGPKR